MSADAILFRFFSRSSIRFSLSRPQIVAGGSVRAGGAGQEPYEQRREMFVIDLSVNMQRGLIYKAKK